MALKYNQNLKQNLKRKDVKKKLLLQPLPMEEKGSDRNSLLSDFKLISSP